jgi:transposase
VAKKPRIYPPELRAEAVRAVIEDGKTPAQVARDFGLVAETVRNWVKAAKSDNSGTTDEARAAIDRARLQEMERRVQELEQENAFLKKAAAFFAKELP